MIRHARTVACRCALAALLAATGLMACEDDAASADAGVAEPADAEGCEHFATGPDARVSATADRAAAPEALQSHTAIVVSLVDIEGGLGGFLTLTVPEAAEYRLLIGPDVPVTLLPEGSDVPLEAEASTAPDGCDIAARVLVFDLPAGAHTLSVGPTSEATLRFVLEAQSEHDHDHE